MKNPYVIAVIVIIILFAVYWFFFREKTKKVTEPKEVKTQTEPGGGGLKNE